MKNSVNDEDMKSHGDSHEFDDLLPRDPFGMGVTINLPNDVTLDISLPVDPFGMEISVETTVSSVSDWIKEFGFQTSQKEDKGAFEGKFDDDDDNGECVAEINFVWAAAQEESKNVLVIADSLMCWEDEASSGLGEVEESMVFGCEKYQDDNRKSPISDEEGSQVDAILFSLGYLGIKELLTVERICKILNDAVRDNPPLWRNICIDKHLCDSITDHDLLQLTNRAQSKLHSLSLEKCMKITTSGLRDVLEANAQLTKLSVAGCTKLTAGSVYESIKLFNSAAQPGIKQLRIGCLPGITEQLLKDFKLLLGNNRKNEPENYKPRFYRDGEMYLSLEDRRVIDVEICPRCQRVGQVYDCPAKECQPRINTSNPCKACIGCIDRCVQCGCCLGERPFEETFFLDSLCHDCVEQLFASGANFYYQQSRVIISPRLNAAC